MDNNSKCFPVLLDATGGDFAPDEVIKGALSAANSLDARIILVGNIDKIKKTADRLGLSLDNIEIVGSTQEVKMGDSPSEVVKNKKDSSIYIGTRLLSEGKGSAFLSAGNTGAVMACSLFNVKRIEGILRPAIAVVIPLINKKVVLIDAGANVECKPLYFKHFAIMGKIYSEAILGVANPAVGLLNVGSERKKGTDTVIEAYDLLEEAPINFIGNVEGRDIFEEKVDVVVCDGFTGNIILKLTEGLAALFFSEIKKTFTSNIITKLAALGLKNQVINLKKKFDYEEYGGAYLLGVNGIVIIAHGSSRAKAFANAIKVAVQGARKNLIGRIGEEIRK